MRKLNIIFYFIFILIFWTSTSQQATHKHTGASKTHSPTHTNQQNYFKAYTLKDKNYGTKTVVKLKNSFRVMTTNALPNHDTGQFPNQGNPNQISAQKTTYTFPLNPIYTGQPTWARTPGVALNGVKFEPGTAEIVQCQTGENYRVEALQDVIDLGLDFNHAHVQPTGAYHYHGSPTSLIHMYDTGKDLVHIGFAHDGFPMYYSKSGKYKPSYKAINGDREGEDCTYENPAQSINIAVNGHHDGTFTSDFEYVEGLGDLDECNGVMVNGNYIYLVTDEFPYVSRCLMGEFENQSGPRPDEDRARRPNRRQNQSDKRRRPPSFAELLEMMDANNDKKLSKQEVKGPLKQDFDKVDANSDGYITEEELKNVKPQRQNNQRPPRGRH